MNNYGNFIKLTRPNQKSIDAIRVTVIYYCQAQDQVMNGNKTKSL